MRYCGLLVCRQSVLSAPRQTFHSVRRSLTEGHRDCKMKFQSSDCLL
jgi:hypothetical protein